MKQEEEIKNYFIENPHLNAEGLYFRGLKSEQANTTVFAHPGKKSQYTWWSAAASLVVGIGVAIFILNDANRHDQYVIDDPKEAYEITRKALMVVSSSIQEGKSYSQELNKINEAEKKLTDEK